MTGQSDRKPRPRVGDVRWVVEWCRERLPEGEDPADYGVEIVREFPGREEALRYAKKVLPQDARRRVEVRREAFRPFYEADAETFPTVGYWEAQAEAEYYEGEG